MPYNEASDQILTVIFENIFKFYGISILLKFRILSKQHNQIIENILVLKFKKISFDKILRSIKAGIYQNSNLLKKIVMKYSNIKYSNFDIIKLIELSGFLENYQNIDFVNNVIKYHKDILINEKVEQSNYEYNYDTISKSIEDKNIHKIKNSIYDNYFIISNLIAKIYQENYKKSYDQSSMEGPNVKEVETLILRIKIKLNEHQKFIISVENIFIGIYNSEEIFQKLALYFDGTCIGKISLLNLSEEILDQLSRFTENSDIEISIFKLSGEKFMDGKKGNEIMKINFSTKKNYKIKNNFSILIQ
jgi:hypothetical protein